MIIDGIRYAQKCKECGKGMNEGYLIQGASECYCSDECLHKNVTPEEFQEFYIGNRDEDDDVGDIEIFWTEWEEEENDQ